MKQSIMTAFNAIESRMKSSSAAGIQGTDAKHRQTAVICLKYEDIKNDK